MPQNASIVQGLTHGTLFLPSVALIPAILMPKGTVGAIWVFVVQLSLITCNGNVSDDS